MNTQTTPSFDLQGPNHAKKTNYFDIQ